MAIRGIPLYVPFIAWNTSTNAGQTGDAANITLQWLKDGVLSPTTNSPTEISASLAPGSYAVLLTGTEADCNLGTPLGLSVTASVQLMLPQTIAFETPLTLQQIRDALKLTPTAGVPATGSIDADLDLILAKTNTIGSGTITVVSPISTGGDFTILKGDDYYALDSRSIDWSATTWPDLTSATIRFSIQSDLSAFTTAGSVVTPTGSTKTVRLELSAAQTALFPAAVMDFEVVATLSDTHHLTLLRGRITVSGE